MHYVSCIYIILLFFFSTAPFFMLINGKKNFSNNDVNDSVVYSVIYLYTWCVTNSSCHGDAEFIKYKVVNICWVSQGTILVNSNTFAWMFSIILCCEDEANDTDRRSFGWSRKDPYHSSLCKYYIDNGSEASYGIPITEGKVHVNKFFWVKVGCLTIRESCHILFIKYCAWRMIYLLRSVFW